MRENGRNPQASLVTRSERRGRPWCAGRNCAEKVEVTELGTGGKRLGPSYVVGQRKEGIPPNWSSHESVSVSRGGDGESGWDVEMVIFVNPLSARLWQSWLLGWFGGGT